MTSADLSLVLGVVVGLVVMGAAVAIIVWALWRR